MDPDPLTQWQTSFPARMLRPDLERLCDRLAVDLDRTRKLLATERTVVSMLERDVLAMRRAQGEAAGVIFRGR